MHAYHWTNLFRSNIALENKLKFCKQSKSDLTSSLFRIKFGGIAIGGKTCYVLCIEELWLLVKDLTCFD